MALTFIRSVGNTHIEKKAADIYRTEGGKAVIKFDRYSSNEKVVHFHSVTHAESYISSTHGNINDRDTLSSVLRKYC